MTAYRLNLLGWTQEEIGRVVGMSQQGVAKILLLFSELKKVVKKLLSEGHTHLGVAERYNMPFREEIGGVIGVSQRQVGNILEEFSGLKKVLKNLLSEGYTHLGVAGHLLADNRDVLAQAESVLRDVGD